MFDIDRTLLDTQKFKILFPRIFSKELDIEERDFETAELGYLSSLESSTDFYHIDYLSFLSRKLRVPLSNLKRIYLDKNLFKKSLFKDTITVLEKLHRKYTLGIFSEGIESFQVLKLKKSGIYKFFDPKQIFIFRRKLETENLQKLLKGAFIVDDKEEVIKALLDYGGFEPVWLNFKSDKKLSGVLTIRRLGDLLNYLV